MAAAKLTKKELDDFAARLRDERTELAEQLTTIEDQAFAATQSDISGDVGVDDESADAGTATFERSLRSLARQPPFLTRGGQLQAAAGVACWSASLRSLPPGRWTRAAGEDRAGG